jgi:isocitrate/isopropylmalate dehydrogenase
MNKTVVALPGEGMILTPPQIEYPGSPVPKQTRRLAREADAVPFGAAGPSTKALTPDQGGSATTTQMAAEVLAAYRNQS